MYLIGREINPKGTMRAGAVMVQVHIINISSGKIGIGRLIHHTEIRRLISGRLLEAMLVGCCLITTQFWVLTGNITIVESAWLSRLISLVCLLFCCVHGLEYDMTGMECFT